MKTGDESPGQAGDAVEDDDNTEQAAWHERPYRADRCRHQNGGTHHSRDGVADLLFVGEGNREKGDAAKAQRAKNSGTSFKARTILRR
jgi:hypothetical protein